MLMAYGEIIALSGPMMGLESSGSIFTYMSGR